LGEGLKSLENLSVPGGEGAAATSFAEVSNDKTVIRGSAEVHFRLASLSFVWTTNN